MNCLRKLSHPQGKTFKKIRGSVLTIQVNFTMVCACKYICDTVEAIDPGSCRPFKQQKFAAVIEINNFVNRDLHLYFGNRARKLHATM